jgi:hypothetical protein
MVYRLLATFSVVAATITACKPEPDIGYVELKTVPPSTAVQQPTFYLDTVRLEPISKGVAVLRQRVGTVKLATELGGGSQSVLCEIAVKKNRITTVTVSVIERPLRCQCRTGPGAKNQPARTCVS